MEQSLLNGKFQFVEDSIPLTVVLKTNIGLVFVRGQGNHSYEVLPVFGSPVLFALLCSYLRY